MITEKASYRGEFGEDDHFSLRDHDSESIVGELVVMTHPAGPMGGGLYRVTEAEEITRTEKYHTGSREGEEYEVDDIGFVAERIVTGQESGSTVNGFPPCTSFALDGATDTLYAIEHENGCGEWVRTSPWRHSPSPEYVWDYFGEYQGHENRRIVEKSATVIDAKNGEVDVTVEPAETEQ